MYHTLHKFLAPVNTSYCINNINNPLVQEIEIWQYEQLVYAQLGIYSGEWDAQTTMGFCDTNGSINLGQTTRPSNNQQKDGTCRIVDFAVPADHRVKVKEIEKQKSTLPLLGNWKNCGTWKWWWYQF